jgi:hypothetical protein
MFTLVEKTSIRNFLGWGAKYVQFDSGIERAFSFIEQLSASGDTSVEDLARALLVKIIGQLARAIGVEVRAHALRADLPTTFATPWGPSGNGGGNEQMS